MPLAILMHQSHFSIFPKITTVRTNVYRDSLPLAVSLCLQTNAWKTLPLDQKKKMLTYIRDKRQRTQRPDADSELVAAETHNALDAAHDAREADPTMAVKSDLYLKMIQQRSFRSRGPGTTGADEGARSSHPNSAYVAPAQVPHYEHATPKFKPRWQLAEGEFFDKPCACGVKHDITLKGKQVALMLHTIGCMMSTFGDSTRTCLTAVEEVQAVGETADEEWTVVCAGCCIWS